MKKEVLIEQKRSKLIIILLMLIIISCNSKEQEYSIETLNDLRPTHIITNKILLKELKNIDASAEFDHSADIFVLYIEKKSNKNYVVSATKTQFSFFKKYKSDYYFKILKGYANYDNRKVLLYGDLKNNLFEKTKENLQDIMYYKKSKDASEIPIIYEPTFIDFTVE